LAATFAESLSMAAVAYTSSKAATDYIKSVLRKERKDIEKTPRLEKKVIRKIYYNKGFRGQMLNRVVTQITSSKQTWLDTMMSEQLHMCPEEYEKPLLSGTIVGISAIVGSLIPLLPFFFLPVTQAVWTALVVSTLALFITGALKAKLTIGNWFKSGFEIALIGMAAAIVGYAIGRFLGTVI